jgi:DNA-binding transcriptional ArsR family regulator
MDELSASFALAALSQPARLEAFRLLVRAGPDGMAAGDIADALGVRQNTMSANLSVLLRAGLVTNSREGRIIRYRADMERMRGLISFLITDCCGGRPDQCAPLLDLLKSPTVCDC